MRKILVLEHITLDGVIQGPGGRKEDTSEGFEYSGWSAPFQDEVLGRAIKKHLDQPCDLLLGRKTFDIWEGFWPDHSEEWPNVMTATKYVASNTRTSSDWDKTVFLSGDVAAKVAELKKELGPDIHVWGSGELVQELFRNDLVDKMFLMTFPITLGEGKRLWDGGPIPATFKAIDGFVSPRGVVAVNYERAGDIEVGNVDEE